MTNSKESSLKEINDDQGILLLLCFPTIMQITFEAMTDMTYTVYGEVRLKINIIRSLGS